MKDKELKELLDSFQLDTISDIDELTNAYIELISGNLSSAEKKKFNKGYKEIKSIISAKKRKSPEKTLVLIKQNCKKCTPKKLPNGIRIPSGKVEFKCNKCIYGIKSECKKCNGTGKIVITCPSCKGKKIVTLKRYV